VNTQTAAFDRVVPPKLPIAEVWTQSLDDGVAVPPVMDGARAYLALRSGHLVARDLTDGKELWKIDRTITSPMAVAGDVLIVSAGNAVEALRGSDHKTLWKASQITTAAPLVAAGERVVVVTDAEAIVFNAATGAIAWRKPAGGISLPPVIDGDRVVLGANDGKVTALALDTGQTAWESFVVEDGVTALGAHAGLVYAGGGDKRFYCLKDGKLGWPVWRVGSVVIGNIAVDDQHVYYAARDNVVRGVDRLNGNQRWQQPVRNRPFSGVIEAGHIVFVPLGNQHTLPMLFAGDGRPSGTITLPREALADLPPAIQESSAGVKIVAVTAGLTNQWQLSLYATTGEPALVPLAEFLPDAGAYLLTDPVLEPIGKVLGSFVVTDPPLLPLSVFGFPIQLLDPPLEPLTTLPGLQMRSLSPQLPSRRGSSGPGG
jgi:outer membrane protein assembly factor BamB